VSGRRLRLDQADVHRAVVKPARNFFGVADTQRQLQPRIAVHEACQQGRQPVAADGGAGPDGQAAALQADELGDFLLGAVFQRENPLGVAINCLPAAG
jgi:hypothetical protein